MNSLYSNIALIGMPGSGKTTIGKILAERLKIDFYDCDDYIEKEANISITEIFERGEEYFRILENKAIKDIMKKAPCIIATGGGVIKIVSNIEMLKENGIIIFINRSVDKIFLDIAVDNRPLLKGKKEKLYQLYDERIELYKKHCDYEIANDKTIDDAVSKILFLVKHDRV